MMVSRNIAFPVLAGLILAAAAVAAANFSLPVLQAKEGYAVFSLTSDTVNPDGSAQNGTVSAIYLTIDQVSLHRIGNDTTNSTGDWLHVSVPSKTIEVLSLRGLTQNLPELAAGKLPIGTYNEVRLRVLSAVATIRGVNETVQVPSGMLKIPEVSITITDGGVTSILIDIGYDSAHVNRNLILRPVAHILSQSHQ